MTCKSFAAIPTTASSTLNTSHTIVTTNLVPKKKHIPINENVRIRDVELLVDNNDFQISSNQLLKTYIDKIIDLRNADTKSIERYIILINKIPGYEAEYLLRNTRSEEDGNKSSEMVINIKRKVVNAILSADNRGAPSLGRYQFGGLVQLMNPIGFNDSLILGAATTNKPGTLQILSSGYLKRLNSLGTSANILISKLKNHPLLNFNDQSLTYKGEIEQYVVLNNTNTLKLELFAQRKLITEQGPANAGKIASYRYNMLTAAVKVKHVDTTKADNSFAVQFNTTLGPAILQSSTRVFDRNFSYLTFDFSRDQHFGEAFSVFTHMLVHYTDNILPIEQQFAVGGGIGRAYSTGLVSANRGLALELELRYTKHMDGRIIDVVQPYIFIEDVFISKPLLPVSFKSLASAGFGIRSLLPWSINANFEFGVPFTKHVSIDGSTAVKNTVSLGFYISKEFKI